MRFGLCVRLGVDLHVRLTEEGRRAHPAPTGGETQKWEGGIGGTKNREEGDNIDEKKQQKGDGGWDGKIKEDNGVMNDKNVGKYKEKWIKNVQHTQKIQKDGREVILVKRKNVQII